MAIVLKNIRLSSNPVYDVMEIHWTDAFGNPENGIVNISLRNNIPFITLEFYDTTSKQLSIRRYFMGKNKNTGIYDRWDGHTPQGLKAYIGKEVKGVFETRDNLTLFIFEHEMSDKSKIDKVFESQAHLGFDSIENHK